MGGGLPPSRRAGPSKHTWSGSSVREGKIFGLVDVLGGRQWRLESCRSPAAMKAIDETTSDARQKQHFKQHKSNTHTHTQMLRHEITMTLNDLLLQLRMLVM